MFNKNKTKKRGWLKRFVVSHFNVRAWSSADLLGYITSDLISKVKKLFVISKSDGQKCSFDEALIKLDFTKERLKAKEREFKVLFLFFGIASLMLFGYLIYVIYKGFFIAILGTVGILGVTLGVSFRFHFWSYQIKKRKLGCSLKEWFYEGLLRKKR